MFLDTTRLTLALLAASSLCACQGGLATQSAIPEHSVALQATGGNGALPDLLGCPYPSGNVYQTSVAAAQIDPSSSGYIAAVVAAPGGAGGFQAWVGTQDINQATNATPLVAVEAGNSYESPYSPIPWASSFLIEKDGDRHAEVMNAQSCQYYEGYKSYYYVSGNYLTMYNNAHVDLTKPFVRPPTGALSTATGIPLGLLAVRPEELVAGVIQHAIGWNAVAGTLNGVAGAPCVSPSGKIHCTDGNVYKGPPSDTPMPYGSHGRLKASFDISGLSREVKIVATAMQKYGLYVYDTGCCNAIILAQDKDGSPVWTSQDAKGLLTITPADFDIVPPPS